jgi:uncharacterized protein (TIGR04141 family)
VSTKSRTVSAYLLRESVTHATHALISDPAELDAYAADPIAPGAVLYVSRKPARAPDWASLFDGVTDRPLELYRPSFAAVLILDTGGRRFALTFGASGRFMLKPGCYERSFGLHAARNLVDPDRIRAVQSTRFADVALQVRRQLSRPSDIVQLDMDVQRDLLVKLEGAIVDGAPGKKLAGADAARFTDVIGPAQLADVCGKLLLASGETHYRTRYPWSDQVAQVTDDREAARLDERALRLLLDGELERFDVYPPEMVEETVAEFGTGRNRTVMEPTRELLAAVIRRAGAVDPAQLAEALRGSYLTALNDEGSPLARWSWWECLYYESVAGGEVHVLHGGVWMRVAADFATVIDSFAASLDPSDLSLPVAMRGELEGPYNARAARDREDLTMLDRKLVRPVPGESWVEICDLFCRRGHLVHVKRNKGGSSTLSHLFAQALVSAQLLARAPQFAEDIRGQLGEWADCVKDPPVRSEHPVVLALMLAAESAGPGARALPFFSKVSLRHSVQSIQGMGFPVCFDEIPAPLPQPRRPRGGGGRRASR